MANHASALKRHRQSLKRRARNRAVRARLKTERKKLATAIESGDQEAAQAQFRVVQKLLDKAASRSIVHKNKTARLLARANTKLNQIG